MIPVLSWQAFGAFLQLQPRLPVESPVFPAAGNIIIVTLADKIRSVDHRCASVPELQAVIIISHTVHIRRIQISHPPEALIGQQQTVTVKGIALLRFLTRRDQFISCDIF